MDASSPPNPCLLKPPNLVAVPVQPILELLRRPLAIGQLHGKARALLLDLGQLVEQPCLASQSAVAKPGIFHAQGSLEHMHFLSM